MTSVIEYFVREFIKIVYVCERSKGIAIGDLPALAWCFKCKEKLSLDSAESFLCNSQEFRVGPLRVTIEGTHVMGKLRSIGFIARGIDCRERPERVYEVVEELIKEVCGSGGREVKGVD